MVYCIRLMLSIGICRVVRTVEKWTLAYWRLLVVHVVIESVLFVALEVVSGTRFTSICWAVWSLGSLAELATGFRVPDLVPHDQQTYSFGLYCCVDWATNPSRTAADLRLS